jgi:hypothetical protein
LRPRIRNPDGVFRDSSQGVIHRVVRDKVLQRGKKAIRSLSGDPASVSNDPRSDGRGIVAGRKAAVRRVLTTETKSLESTLEKSEPTKILDGVRIGQADRGDSIGAVGDQLCGQPVDGAVFGFRTDRERPAE